MIEDPELKQSIICKRNSEVSTHVDCSARQCSGLEFDFKTMGIH